MKIGIVGLGLIGGSIFKDLTSFGYEVIGISNSQIGENIYKDYEYLKDCNLVFVCHPMNKTLETLDKLQNYLSSETIVTDVCSLKEFVSKKEYSYKFIPSHPMAGTENKGFDSSFEGLFKGAKWAICPMNDDKISLNSLIEIVKKLGAEPVLTTPKEHDEAVAMISHMPMVISQALFLAAQDNPLAMKLAASGFKGMTRLAMSNEEMAFDMVRMNHKNIENSILKLYKAVGDLTGGNYPELIAKIKDARKKLQ